MTIPSQSPWWDPTPYTGPPVGSTLDQATFSGVRPNAFLNLFRILYPTMPEDFITAASEAWAAYSDQGMDFVLATLRGDARYESWFPGNLTPTGEVHLSEGDYTVTMNQYRDAVEQLGVSANVFSQDQYVDLIRGDVDVSEWQARVRGLSNEVLATADSYGLREYYSELYNIPGISDAAILESAFSQNADAIRRQIGQAVVGLEGEIRGFDIPLQLASSLYDANIRTQAQSSELFAQGAEAVPLFGALIQRHFDPNDEYDLGSFLEAAVFDDQDELARQRRLIAQERAMFSAYRPLRERSGAITGLTAE